MTRPDERPRSVLVVNSTEWRNLCARGSMRVLAARVQPLSEAPTSAEFARAFASAPTTKPDSTVDTFVLEVRPEWPELARHHALHDGVVFLDLDDVISHHVVANQDHTYYAPQAHAAGIELSSKVYEAEWQAWSAGEKAEASLEAAYTLMGAFQIENSTTADVWRPLVQAITARDPQSASLAPLHSKLVRVSAKIDDAAASVRGSQAYWLATALEWVDEATGVYPRDVAGRHASSFAWGLESGKQLNWHVPNVHEVERALLLVQQEHAKAFGDGVSAFSVGRTIRLLAESRHTVPKPESISDSISSLAKRPDDEGALVCIVAAAAIGPELVRQLVVQRNKADNAT